MKKAFKLALIVSAMGFYYLIIPTNTLLFILKALLITMIVIPIYLTQFYLQLTMVKVLRKRYQWARKVFITPPRY